VTVYTPYPKVIFAGVNEFADNTISDISISLGRRDIYEQALVGIANVRLWTDADTALNVNLIRQHPNSDPRLNKHIPTNLHGHNLGS
jgi:hypothetical protein